jgi:hypothetical protein
MRWPMERGNLFSKHHISYVTPGAKDGSVYIPSWLIAFLINPYWKLDQYHQASHCPTFIILLARPNLLIVGTCFHWQIHHTTSHWLHLPRFHKPSVWKTKLYILQQFCRHFMHVLLWPSSFFSNRQHQTSKLAVCVNWLFYSRFTLGRSSI